MEVCPIRAALCLERPGSVHGSIDLSLPFPAQALFDDRAAVWDVCGEGLYRFPVTFGGSGGKIELSG
jgi:hypothetical protein